MEGMTLMRLPLILPAVLAVLLAPGPGLRAEEPAPPAAEERGADLVEQGMKLLLRGILDEMGTSLDEMQQGLSEAAKEIGPALRDLLALIDDVQNYEAPERLPNGDVILRRKPGAPPPPDLPQAPAAPESGIEGGAEAIEL